MIIETSRTLINKLLALYKTHIKRCPELQKPYYAYYDEVTEEIIDYAKNKGYYGLTTDNLCKLSKEYELNYITDTAFMGVLDSIPHIYHDDIDPDKEPERTIYAIYVYDDIKTLKANQKQQSGMKQVAGVYSMRQRTLISQSNDTPDVYHIYTTNKEYLALEAAPGVNNRYFPDGELYSAYIIHMKGSDSSSLLPKLQIK